MIKTDNPDKYDKRIVLIHWLTALLVFIMFPLGNMLEDLEEVTRVVYIMIHTVLGLIILILTLFRSWYNMKVAYPDPVKTDSIFNSWLIIWVHRMFYILLFVISLTGILIVFTGDYLGGVFSQTVSPDPEKVSGVLDCHDIASQSIIILSILHIAGILKHHILKKGNAFKRMS